MFANKDLLRALRRDRGDVIGTDVLEVLPKGMRPSIEELLARIGEAGGDIVEEKVVWEDSILGESRYTVQGAADGDFTYLFLKKLPVADAALSRRLTDLEDRLTALLSLTASAGIGLSVAEVMKDGSTKVRSVNDHVQAIIDRSEEELIDHDIFEYLHPEDKVTIRDHLHSLREDLFTPRPLQMRVVDRSGDLVRIQASTTWLTSAEDRLLISFIQDMTPVAEALDQQNRMVQAIERIDETVVLGDEKGRIFYINPAGLRNSGYTFEELAGQPIAIFSPTETGSSFHQQAMTDLVRDGKWRGDVMARTKDGKPYPVEVIANLIRNERGEPSMFIVVSRKIEERQRYEAQLVLARSHAEFLKEIYEREVNPAIEQAVELLAEGISPEGSQAMDMGKLETALGKLRSVLWRTEEMASIDPRLDTAEKLRPVPIARLLRERIPLVKERHRERGIDLTLETEDDDIAVMANDMLMELLSRMLMVVLEVHPKEPITMRVKIERMTAPDAETDEETGQPPSYAKISLVGPGIALPRDMLGMFSRRDMPPPDAGGEFAFAMETVRLIIFLYKGHVYIEDIDPEDPQKGSMIVLLLPLAD